MPCIFEENSEIEGAVDGCGLSNFTAVHDERNKAMIGKRISFFMGREFRNMRYKFTD